MLAALVVAALAGCRAPYVADYAAMTVLPEELPAPGTTPTALEDWFAEQSYAPGPRVLQSEGELLRRPGDPLIYAQPGDREWWLTQHRTVRDFCVTRRTVYYRLAPDGRLERAIGTHRSYC
jgi:hypothetical protein